MKHELWMTIENKHLETKFFIVLKSRNMEAAD